MKAVSQTYKDNIKQLGKEITYEITYDNTTLGDEDILNANLHYDGGMLKSVMKQLDIELYNDIPIGTELNYKFGVKVDDTNYEMVDYGKFIVYSSEKLEDSNTYKLVCYDKMLYAMKDYEAFSTFPITIRDYINALCNHLELTFANTTDDFTNYDKTIENELYIDNEGNNIGYTYRDVLDEIAQATASTICVENDELVLKDITNANEEKTSISGTSLSMTAHDNKVDIDLLGNTTQETTTGKNLLKNDLATRTESGITITKNSDGTYKVNGTATADISLAINNDFVSMSGTWRMLGCPSGGSSTTYMLSAYVGYWGGGSPNIDTGSGTNITYTGNVKVRFYIKSGTTCNNLIFKPMLTTDTSTTINNWEPYTYGASPNPNYPQNIETITGRNTIDVCGKNLLNVADGTYSNNGLTATMSNGQISVSGTSTATSFLSIIFNTLSLKAGTYTLSANNSSSYNDNDFYLRITTKNGSNVLGPAKMNVVNAKTTFTLNEDLNEGCLQVRASSGDTLNNFVIIPQLEKGSSSSSYEPYVSQTYPVNLGKNLFDEEQLLQATGWQKENDYYTGNTSNLRNYFINTAPMYNSYKENTRYTFSWKGYLGTATNVRIRITYTDSSTQESAYITTTSLTSSSITSQVNKTISSININYSNNGTLFIKDLQLEEGSTATSYSPYFEPIELCKIGTYQDRLFKASGKNLFDEILEQGTFNGNGINVNDGTRIRTKNYISVQPNTTYYLNYTNLTSKTLQASVSYYSTNDYTTSRLSYLSWSTTKPLSFTTPSGCNYIRFLFAYTDNTSISTTNVVSEVMLNSGASSLTYEPFGKDWYIYKEIGKVVLNSTYRAGGGTTGTNAYYIETNVVTLNDNSKELSLCNMFKPISFNNRNNGLDVTYCQNGHLYLRTANNTSIDWSNNTKRDDWLNENKPIAYYVLATPTYTKIENEELIGQLEHIRLLNGYNNVISSSPITLDYVSNIDTIDEEYLKDINVNFGEMTKPINTITFKRSGDTDVISLSYPEDLEDDKKNEIAISDNQILNYDNRDEYLKGILDKLYGLTYCLNDYTSTGITYYDLCDRYDVSITRTDVDGNTLETNYYPCVMFNDEINVNQGLQEIVHTDRAEESITDYNTTTKTDRLKTRTDLIVNKQEGFIEAVTGSLQIGEDGQSEVVNGVVSRQTETERTINVITSFDENGNPTGVKTEKGFTFDKNGLNITSSDNTYKTQIDEQGTYYYDGSEKLGETTKEGSKFKNMDLYGEFHYGMDKITDNPLFVSLKFSETNNGTTEQCFGHFWNGD